MKEIATLIKAIATGLFFYWSAKEGLTVEEAEALYWIAAFAFWMLLIFHSDKYPKDVYMLRQRDNGVIRLSADLWSEKELIDKANHWTHFGYRLCTEEEYRDMKRND